MDLDDKYRVILQSNSESDYINASFIEVKEKVFEWIISMYLLKDMYNNRRYIAAQGPIDESVTDFIRMIWEFQITSVICTANDIEAGRVSDGLSFIDQLPDFSSVQIPSLLARR